MLKILIYLILAESYVLAQRQCNLFCDEHPSPFGARGSESIQNYKGDPGSPGKQGPTGSKGEKGDVLECDCSRMPQLNETLQRIVRERGTTAEFEDLPRTCSQLPNNNNNHNGVYYIRDSNNIKYPVYCDMNIDGGGWTLVASIHENNIKANGRCSTGDKWSSENGNQEGSQLGGEAWFNYAIFGNVISATSEDYKNAAYFELQSRDVMIWQVPNDTPLSHFSSSSYLQYYTTNGFLSRYGGNMFHLYKDHFPLKSGVYTAVRDNGPAIPITYVKGNNNEVRRHFGTGIHSRVDFGYIQFRAVNNERNVYALCPGTRGKSNYRDVEHSCIGSTGDNNHINYCGDFAAFSWNGYGNGQGSNTDLTLLQTTFLIFYR